MVTLVRLAPRIGPLLELCVIFSFKERVFPSVYVQSYIMYLSRLFIKSKLGSAQHVFTVIITLLLSSSLRGGGASYK